MIGRMVWAVPGHLALLGTFFWWTGLSDANRGEVLLSVAVAVVWLIAFLLLQRRIFAGARWAEAISRARFWAAIGLFVSAVLVARLIVVWIPNLPGLPWQLASAGLRFGLAWLLLNAGWCAIAWQSGLPPAEDHGLAVSDN